jgi:polysaccharide deacetylase family sporulation protein PdaB
MKFLVINYRKTSIIVCFILAVILVFSAFIINGKDKGVEVNMPQLQDEVYIEDELEVAARTGRELPIYSVQTETNQIAITFDNAWGADDIPTILRALDKYKVKATFFVLGCWVEKYPDVVKDIYKRGHEIANHSYAHYKPTKLDKAGLLTEITKCNEAIKKVTGKDCNIYRTPYGDYNDFVITTAKEASMYPIQWDVDSIDWKPETTEQDILNRVTEKTKPGSILLFHNDTKYTAKVLPEVLKQLLEKGFEPVTVSELIHKGDYTVDYSGRQFKK